MRTAGAFSSFDPSFLRYKKMHLRFIVSMHYHGHLKRMGPTLHGKFKNKTKAQLVEELLSIQRHVADLEKLKIGEHSPDTEYLDRLSFIESLE
jgi:hypothetical protein